jgi:hypothetical protein
MASLIKPAQATVVTKNGELEITIKLDLNINLNSSGVAIEAQAIEQKPETKEEPIWALPSFVSKERVKFGKTE